MSLIKKIVLLAVCIKPISASFDMSTPKNDNECRFELSEINQQILLGNGPMVQGKQQIILQKFIPRSFVYSLQLSSTKMDQVNAIFSKLKNAIKDDNEAARIAAIYATDIDVVAPSLEILSQQTLDTWLTQECGIDNKQQRKIILACLIPSPISPSAIPTPQQPKEDSSITASRPKTPEIDSATNTTNSNQNNPVHSNTLPSSAMPPKNTSPSISKKICIGMGTVAAVVLIYYAVRSLSTSSSRTVSLQ